MSNYSNIIYSGTVSAYTTSGYTTILTSPTPFVPPVKKTQPSAEDQANPTTRVSIYGNHYPTSVESDWAMADGVGWVHKMEDAGFKAAYRKCVITGKWFETGHIFQATGDNQFVSAEGVKKAKWIQCAASGRYTDPEETVQAFASNHDTVYVSKWFLTRGKLEVCDYTKESFIPGSLKKVSLSEKYRTICMKALKDSGVFSQCCHCAVIYETSAGLIENAPELSNRPYCAKCYSTVARKSAILAHNATGYPKAIYREQTRLGSYYAEDGLIYATLKPEPIKHIRLFGVEVEVEMHVPGVKKERLDRFLLALHVKKTLGTDFVMVKEDGSLLMNGKYDGSVGPDTGPTYAGFEIVSAPADMATHRERWFRLLETPSYKHLRAWDTETCGLHVHVSKEALTTLQIGRILYFINHPGNQQFIHKVAGRGCDRYCRYIPKEPADILHPENVISPEEDNDHHRRRRVALNISPKHTIEFRIFRGTVNPKHILRDLEFCDALCDYGYPSSRSLMEFRSPEGFIAFVGENRKRWSFLAEWMGSHEMIVVNKPGAKADLTKVTLRPETVEENEIRLESPRRPDTPSIPRRRTTTSVYETIATSSRMGMSAPSSKPRKATLKRAEPVSDNDYYTLQAESGIEVGDKITVARVPTKQEKDRWPGNWLSSMDDHVKRSHIVTGLKPEGIDIGEFYYPFFILNVEKKKDAKAILNYGAWSQWENCVSPLSATDNYIKSGNSCGIQAGDEVKVLRKVFEEHEGGWQDTWQPEMDQSIGNIYKVQRVDDGCIKLEDGCWYPYFVLKVISKGVGNTNLVNHDWLINLGYNQNGCVIYQSPPRNGYCPTPAPTLQKMDVTTSVWDEILVGRR